MSAHRGTLQGQELVMMLTDKCHCWWLYCQFNIVHKEADRSQPMLSVVRVQLILGPQTLIDRRLTVGPVCTHYNPNCRTLKDLTGINQPIMKLIHTSFGCLMASWTSLSRRFTCAKNLAPLSRHSLRRDIDFSPSNEDMALSASVRWWALQFFWLKKFKARPMNFCF